VCCVYTGWMHAASFEGDLHFSIATDNNSMACKQVKIRRWCLHQKWVLVLQLNIVCVAPISQQSGGTKTKQASPRQMLQDDDDDDDDDDAQYSRLF